MASLVVLLIVAGVLGMMPMVSYYFGWLAGRPIGRGLPRRVLWLYVAVLVGLIAAICAAVLSQSLAWGAILIWPLGGFLVLSVTLAIWFFFGFAPGCGPEDECLHCGYDLRGNVSGVCPECGRLVGEV